MPSETHSSLHCLIGIFAGLLLQLRSYCTFEEGIIARSCRLVQLEARVSPFAQASDWHNALLSSTVTQERVYSVVFSQSLGKRRGEFQLQLSRLASSAFSTLTPRFLGLCELKIASWPGRVFSRAYSLGAIPSLG